jgi:orotate phosphoribosyltransferase
MSEWKSTDKQVDAPGHYSSFFNPLKFRELVEKVDDVLQLINKRLPFDGIATCGHSGNIIGAALSYRMGIPLVVIRKACENSNTHHGLDVTGIRDGRVLLIDDLIETGATTRHMLDMLAKSKTPFGDPRNLQPVGILLTRGCWSWGRPTVSMERRRWAETINPKKGQDYPVLPVFNVNEIAQDEPRWPALCPDPENGPNQVAAREAEQLVTALDRANLGYVIEPKPEAAAGTEKVKQLLEGLNKIKYEWSINWTDVGLLADKKDEDVGLQVKDPQLLSRRSGDHVGGRGVGGGDNRDADDAANLARGADDVRDGAAGGDRRRVDDGGDSAPNPVSQVVIRQPALYTEAQRYLDALDQRARLQNRRTGCGVAGVSGLVGGVTVDDLVRLGNEARVVDVPVDADVGAQRERQLVELGQDGASGRREAIGTVSNVELQVEETPIISVGRDPKELEVPPRWFSFKMRNCRLSFTE